MAAFDDELHQMIAVLHDAVEDSGGEVTIEILRGLGVPEIVIAAVDALTHRDGEERPVYLRRVKSDPHALAVKAVDNRDNSDESRLALLDSASAARLREKYATDRQVLGLEA